jgi:hypothetical protein
MRRRLGEGGDRGQHVTSSVYLRGLQLQLSYTPVQVWCESAQGWPQGGPSKVVRYPLKITLVASMSLVIGYTLLSTLNSLLPHSDY